MSSRKPATDFVAVAQGFLTTFADTFADPRKTEQLVSTFVKADEKGARRIVIPPDIERAAICALDAFGEIVGRSKQNRYRNYSQ